MATRGLLARKAGFLSLAIMGVSSYDYPMSIRSAFISVVISSLLFAASAFAQTSSIEGTASEVNGKPLKNAEVRIQKEKEKNILTTVKTDAKGHFLAARLASGVYTVTVVQNGTVKWSAAHVKTKNGQAVHLNLGEHSAVAVTAANAKPKRRAVWVPESVGSHLGGHWEDEPVRGPDADNVDTASTHQFEQLQRTPSAPSANGGR